MKKYILAKSTLYTVLLLLPNLVLGQGITYECVTGTGANAVYGNCSWADLIGAVTRFFNVVFPIVIGLSVVVIAYAGFNYMQSGANPGKRSEANRMLRYVAIGIFFMMGAWLIVNLISTTLINQSFRGSVPIMQP